MTRDTPREERMLTYLARAEDALRIAATIKDPETRAIWENVAEGWEQLAEHLAHPFPGR